ncbi:MAG: SMP-30/gluconolactonase/LRE family protein [Cellvibrionales bacterium]|nr:SMP-30/gluconolactonase/LRE family protein [Cellvibrionales bacterium]
MKIETLASNLTFTECPRWHQNKLWFSDFHSQRVYSLDSQGNLNVELTINDQPAGLGFTPNGELRIVSQTQKRLLAFDGQSITTIADMSSLATGNCNDMVMTRKGGAYIGNFGFDFHADDFRPKAANLIFVAPDGKVSKAAENLFFPNGSVIIDDTLIVAESMGYCLTAFTINADGSLSNRRCWADLGQPKNFTIDQFRLGQKIPGAITPDGIALAKDGGIWVAPLKKELIKVIEGGEVVERIPFDQSVIAVAVSDKNDLYVCTTNHLTPNACLKHRSARIERVVFD